LGYQGRIGIFELLPLSVELQKLISRDEVTISEIHDAAQKSGMITMEQDGVLKVIEGVTSIEEVMRAVHE
jgi:type II secretory ATPase GspE/PulE/Tfp pilus assembly ATPase PilB-like protein